MKNLYIKTAIAASALLLSSSTFAFITFTKPATETSPNAQMAQKIASIANFMEQELCADLISSVSNHLGPTGLDFTADATNQGSYTRTLTAATTLAAAQLAIMKAGLAGEHHATCIGTSTLVVGASQSTAPSASSGTLVSAAKYEVDALFTLGSSSCSPGFLNSGKFYMTIVNNGGGVKKTPTSCAIHFETGNSAVDDVSLASQVNSIFKEENYTTEVTAIDSLSSGS